jgi:hypothetical protein
VQKSGADKCRGFHQHSLTQGVLILATWRETFSSSISSRGRSHSDLAAVDVVSTKLSVMTQP